MLALLEKQLLEARVGGDRELAALVVLCGANLQRDDLALPVDLGPGQVGELAAPPAGDVRGFGERPHVILKVGE